MHIYSCTSVSQIVNLPTLILLNDSDSETYYIHHTIKQISQNGCTNIPPELEGFRRPNWAQIKADLCVSDMGGLIF